MKTYRPLILSTFAGLLALGLVVPVISAPKDSPKGEAAWSTKKETRGDRGGKSDAERGPRRPGGPGMGGPGHGPGGPGGMGGPGPLAMLGRIMHPFWENERLAEKLELTPEQVELLTESLQVTRDELEATEGSIVDAADALRAEMEKDNPDLDTTYALHDAVHAAVNVKTRVMLSHAVTVKNILTAEQEEILKQGRPGGGPGEHPAWGSGKGLNIMKQAKEIIADGGGPAEIEALLEAEGIPEPARERIMERVEDYMAGDRPMPPPDRPGRGERGERPERPERPDRPERPERPDRPERPAEPAPEE